jgi:hypothetical protein
MNIGKSKKLAMARVLASKHSSPYLTNDQKLKARRAARHGSNINQIAELIGWTDSIAELEFRLNQINIKTTVPYLRQSKLANEAPIPPGKFGCH